MSKYFDKLLKMNESLDAELKKRGLEFVKENEDEEMVSVPADSLSDEQKEDIIAKQAEEAGLDSPDKKTIEDIAKDPEKMAAVQTILGGDDQQNENESTDDVSEEVVIRMDDDDLDMHGFLKNDDGLDVRELEWTDDIKAAKVFQHEELGQNAIEAICSKFHYDPSTFKTVSVDPRADEPYEDDESEQWISLNPLDPSATTLG